MVVSKRDRTNEEEYQSGAIGEEKVGDINIGKQRPKRDLSI